MPARYSLSTFLDGPVAAIERQTQDARIRSLRLDLDIERDARADDVRALAALNRRLTEVQREVIAREDLLAKVGKEWGEPHEGCPDLNSDVCYEPNCFDGYLVEVKS
jgi:hypothetical protein